MNQPKALFLDMDGTILKEDFTFTTRVNKAIHALIRSNTLVCLASGRSWEAIKPTYDKLELVSPAICYNGAVIVGGPDGRYIFESIMDKDVARFTIEYVRSNPQMTMIAYHNKQLIYEQMSPKIKAYEIRVNLKGKRVDFDSFIKLGLTKCIAISDKEHLAAFQINISKRFSQDRFNAFCSSANFLEVVAGGADKGNGIRKICQQYTIPISQTVAIGDGWNDLSMLQTAGTSWVMGNAPPDLKASFSADRIAHSVEEDGAAIIMEQMIQE